MSSIYRAEIDGLRAFAVLSVIFFHAGFSGFSGGFVGVDVFFVISGFLITGILISENKNENFSIINFYERRARRLLPALFFVLTITILLSILILTPNDFHHFSKSILPTVAIYSNVFFAETTSYFSPHAESMPLLHMWSLSLEEQFYLFFPLILSACFLFKEKSKVVVFSFLVTCAIFSYTIMVVAQSLGISSFAFFSLPTRAWELLSGGILAFMLPYLKKTNVVLNQCLAFLGAFYIALSVVFLNKESSWPSHETLLPVFGTLLILGFGTRDTIIGKALSFKPFVIIGLMSYSLYLWHQPLLVFSRAINIGPLSILSTLLTIGLSLLLAYGTYVFIESPFRNKQRFSRSSIFCVSIALGAAISTSGLYLSSLDGAKERYLDNAASTFEIKPRYADCITTYGDDRLPGDPFCHLNPSKKVTFATLGDSHSNSIAIALSKLVPNIGVQEYARSECPPAYNYEIDSLQGCREWAILAKNQIIENSDISTVFLMYRASYYPLGENVLANPKSLMRTHKGASQLSNQEAYLHDFSILLEELKKSGKKIVVFEPIPELPDHMEKLFMPTWIGGETPRTNLERAVSLDEYNSRHDWVLTWLREQKGITVIKTSDILCSGAYCPATLNNTPAYFDSNHITPIMAEKLVESALNKLY